MTWDEAVSLALSPTTFSAIVVAALSLRLELPPTEVAAAFAFLVLGPVVPVLALARFGAADIFVSDRATRTPLLILAVASYAAGFLYFQHLGVREVEFAFLAYALVTSGMTLVNELHTKGSIHVAGVVGPGLTLLLLGDWVGAAVLAAAPAVGWVRLRMGAHSPSQVLIGALAALVLTPAAYAALWLA
ncbi:MAG: hypothetical protein QI223_10100 [Candidatus Korarchaeota archaeon]|nr:hypothetical protein [Candidatus Korarchaeota archaeon]